MINKLHFEIKDSKNEQKALAAITKERDSIGYYALPSQDISPILSYCESIPQEVDTIAVIGIGGSSLGAKAVYEFIKPVKELSRKLYFFESTDPINIMDILSKFDIKKAHFLVISKSGSTVETFSVYKYIYAMHSDPSSYTFITDPDSPLEKYAQEIKASVLRIPDNVGGRFSVLSSVGLVPLAMCGVDIGEMLSGSQTIKNSFFENGYIQEKLLKKAVYYAKHHAEYSINCIFAYSETLKYFSEWYVQLWAESLGKYQRHSAFKVGLTPVGLIGPKDQHSFLQLIMEGTRNKSVTFIKIDDFHESAKIPDISLPHLESLDNLNQLPFSKLINMQCDAVIEALLDEGSVPVDVITLDCVTENNIGQLIFYYELLTSLVGELIDVNTYDQPGVEAGKIILKKKLADL